LAIASYSGKWQNLVSELTGVRVKTR